MGMMRPRYDRAGSAIYRDPRWKSVRWLAKRRDGFKCRDCGAAGRLEVHHIRPVRSHPELAFDLANLKSLCPACHGRITRIEVGLAPPDPAREAWKSLVRDLHRKPQASQELFHA